MNRFFKLAAAMLVLVLFGTPVVALVNCSPKVTVAGHCDGEDCPMMHARQDTGPQVSSSSSGDGSCCQVSDLPPTNERPAVTTVDRTSLQLPGLSTSVLPMAVPVLAAGQGPPVQSLLALGPAPQAVLCTFLI